MSFRAVKYAVLFAWWAFSNPGSGKAELWEFRFQEIRNSKITDHPQLRVEHFNIWSGRRIPAGYDRSGAQNSEIVYSWKLKLFNQTSQNLQIGVVVLLFDRGGVILAGDTNLVDLAPGATTVHPHPFPQMPEKDWKKADLTRTLVTVCWGEDLREFYALQESLRKKPAGEQSLKKLE